eukprot:1395247-Rhodomonas_salina.3
MALPGDDARTVVAALTRGVQQSVLQSGTPRHHTHTHTNPQSRGHSITHKREPTISVLLSPSTLHAHIPDTASSVQRVPTRPAVLVFEFGVHAGCERRPRPDFGQAS